MQGKGPGEAELRSESVREGGWMGDSGAEQGPGERVQGKTGGSSVVLFVYWDKCTSNKLNVPYFY